MAAAFDNHCETFINGHIFYTILLTSINILQYCIKFKQRKLNVKCKVKGTDSLFVLEEYVKGALTAAGRHSIILEGGSWLNYQRCEPELKKTIC